MKHSYILGLMALACASVQAQSSVTLSGIVDTAARSVSNEGQGSIRSLVSGSNATSRLVVRGTEDLGGGLSASFWLEHGIAVDTGLPTGGFWDRRSTVSLISKKLGEIRLGRDYMPTYLNWSRFDPYGHVGVAGSNNAVVASQVGPIRSAFGTGANTTVRTSDSIQYWLPGDLGGLEGQVTLGAGEGSSNKVISARLGYSAGPLFVSGAHAVTENTITTTGKFTDSALGATYSFGNARASAVWRQFKQAASKQTNLVLSAIVSLGQGDIKLSYIRIDMAGRVGNAMIDANDASQIGLGYVYNLSKRSALYATAARVSNDGAATFSIPGGPAGLAGGKKSTGYEAGLRHSF